MKFTKNKNLNLKKLDAMSTITASGTRTISVSFYWEIGERIFRFSKGERLSCEHITWQCLTYLRPKICIIPDGSGNLTQYLPAFGLLDNGEANHWYPSSHTFDWEDGSKKVRFSVKCRPPLAKYEENNIVWEYLLLQCVHEFLHGEVGKITYTERLGQPEVDKKLLLQLCQVALLIPKTLPLDGSKTLEPSYRESFKVYNYHKQFSKELFRRINADHHIFNRFRNYFIYYYNFTHHLTKKVEEKKQLRVYKQIFLFRFIETFPQYGFDIFKVKVRSVDLIPENTTFFITVYKDQIQKDFLCGLYYLYRHGDHDEKELKGTLNQVEALKLVKPTSTNLDWTVIIELSKIGAQDSMLFLHFQDKAEAVAVIDTLLGYRSLCIDPDCNVQQFVPPSVTVRQTLKAFGPWSTEKAKEFLKNSNAMKPSQLQDDFVLYQDKEDYNSFHTVQTRSNETYSIEWNSDRQLVPKFILRKKDNRVLGTFNNINELKSVLKKRIGKQLVWKKGTQRIESDSIYAIEENGGYETTPSFHRDEDSPVVNNNFSNKRREDFDAKGVISEDPLTKHVRVIDKHDNDFMMLETLTGRTEHKEALWKAVSTHRNLILLDERSFIRFYGQIIDHTPIWLFECPPLGSLTGFLNENELPILTKMALALEVVKILKPLEEFYKTAKNCVEECKYHGNICSKNLFVFWEDEKKVRVKLGSPGMGYFYDAAPHQNEEINDERSPWMAPEKNVYLKEKKWSVEIEVYSVGTTICEIFHQSDDFRSLLNCPEEKLSGHVNRPDLATRLKLPALKQDNNDVNCPSSEVLSVTRKVWEAVTLCWMKDPMQRPSVGELNDTFKALKTEAAEISCKTKTDELKPFLSAKLQNVSPNMMEEKLSSEDRSFIPSKLIVKSSEKLGSGHYGAVVKGTLLATPERQEMEVAIKESKKLNSAEEREAFQTEIKLTTRLSHENIVKCVGFTFNESTMSPDLVLEYMSHGSLADYVKKNRSDFDDRNKCVGFTRQLMKCLLGAVKGMVYIGGKNIVHRDLAARNILLGKGKNGTLVTKVCDFGLASVYKDEKMYYTATKQRSMPRNCFPPEYLERILDRQNIQFNRHGDVWSFGFIVWEAFNPGKSPSKFLADLPGDGSDNEIYKIRDYYKAGKRLPQSEYMSDELYNIVRVKCWAFVGKERAEFVELEQIFKKLLEPHLQQ